MRVEKIYFYISKALFATTCVCTFTFTKDKGKVCFQPNIKAPQILGTHLKVK